MNIGTGADPELVDVAQESGVPLLGHDPQRPSWPRSTPLRMTLQPSRRKAACPVEARPLTAELAEKHAPANDPATIPKQGGVPLLKHDRPPAEVTEDYAAENDPATTLKESGVSLLKHDLQPAEMAANCTAT